MALQLRRVVNTTLDSAGDPVGARLQIALVGSDVGYTDADGTVEVIYEGSTDPTTGKWSVDLVCNDTLTPSGTVYRATETVGHEKRDHVFSVPTTLAAIPSEHLLVDLLSEVPAALASGPLAAHLINPDAHATGVAAPLTLTPTGVEDGLLVSAPAGYTGYPFAYRRAALAGKNPVAAVDVVMSDDGTIVFAPGQQGFDAYVTSYTPSVESGLSVSNAKEGLDLLGGKVVALQELASRALAATHIQASLYTLRRLLVANYARLYMPAFVRPFVGYTSVDAAFTSWADAMFTPQRTDVNRGPLGSYPSSLTTGLSGQGMSHFSGDTGKVFLNPANSDHLETTNLGAGTTWTIDVVVVPRFRTGNVPHNEPIICGSADNGATSNDSVEVRWVQEAGPDAAYFELFSDGVSVGTLPVGPTFNVWWYAVSVANDGTNLSLRVISGAQAGFDGDAEITGASVATTLGDVKFFSDGTLFSDGYLQSAAIAKVRLSDGDREEHMKAMLHISSANTNFAP